jgi:cell wall-associated NlpC family hydrolase
LLFPTNDNLLVTFSRKFGNTVVLSSVVLLGALCPTFAHSHHHRHHHLHIAAAPDTSHQNQASAIDTANKYSHLAAVQLASQVNQTRRALSTVHHLSKHELRVAKIETRRESHGIRVAMVNRALDSGNVVQAAYSLRGSRYRMGGTSRSGFDCSGFVRYILGNAEGVDLPRTATEQYYHGNAIATGDLQPGDLVFFKNTYKHGISHVGIYTGNGKFMHAANSHKGVREDSLDEPYYAKHYAGARRVLNTRQLSLQSNS